MPGLGDEFRAAREARHLSLSDVSEHIHIRSVYLQSIEEGDATFAAPVYVRGFIRTYARFLGLDAEAAVAYFNGSLGAAPTRSHDPVAVSLSSERRPSPWLWAAALAAAVLVAFVGYRYVELQRRDGGAAPATVVGVASPAVTAAAAAPVKPAVAAPTPKPLPVRTLSVRVTQDSWMRVTVDGAAVLEGIVKAGTSKSFHGKSVDVRAGNAGGVELTLNGKALGKMGNAGDVVERSLSLAEE